MDKNNGGGKSESKFIQVTKKILKGIWCVFQKICTICGKICDIIFKLRKVILALPVIAGSAYLAKVSMEKLPDTVGLLLQESGTFAERIPKDIAVYGPVALTAACLLLMFCSRRVLYPWVISIFTLILPIFILLINQFPV